ncbi:MAG TPA: hypothetical protein DHV48_11300 [Prolixibacteraceae bacterium]|nr:hypothetical protein [Prolixibacteraceae bacterium]
MDSIKSKTTAKNYMSLGVSVQATKFAPDGYGEPQSVQSPNGYSCESKLLLSLKWKLRQPD